MKTIILCGGRGTRMREETEYRPKPLVTVGGQPILWHIMKLYTHHGFREFVLCLGYRGEMIKDYFLNYEALRNDFTISLGGNRSIAYHGDKADEFVVTLADTGFESMTGARVKRVEHYIDGDTFMLTYGDGLSDVNVKKLLEFHQSHDRLATVTTVRPVSRFGLLKVESEGTVSEFTEKPVEENWISSGYFVFDRKVFDYLSAEDGCVMETAVLERLAQEDQLMAFRHEGFFAAMDTYRDFLHLNNMWNADRVPWAVWRLNHDY